MKEVFLTLTAIFMGLFSSLLVIATDQGNRYGFTCLVEILLATSVFFLIWGIIFIILAIKAAKREEMLKRP
jgi:hypothetical protein